MPTENDIQKIATQIALLPDGKAKLDRLLADERARLDREARRVATERAKLEAAAMEEEARRVAEENARERAAAAERDRVVAAEWARKVADVGRLAVEFVAAVQATGNYGNGDADVMAAIAPFLNRELAHTHSGLSAWVPSMILTVCAHDRYGADSRIIDTAMAHVAQLDATAKTTAEGGGR